MFTIVRETPLLSDCQASYRGLAYDGCSLYLTQGRDCAVDQFDPCGEFLRRFETCRRYSSLCFDPKQCCFWAASLQCPNSLFRLDGCFREIDRITPEVHGLGAVTGVSFQCCDERLLTAFSGGIALVDREGHAVWERKTPQWTRGVLSLCPYFIRWSLQDGETTARLYDKDYRELDFCRIPGSFQVEAAVLDPCADPCEGCIVYLLANKRGSYPYLLRCVLQNECVCRNLCPCNGQLCCCRRPPCKTPCACSDALESIALMETALSHILNAEGEKLQKVIASTDDPRRLLEVNRAVNATLINATHLEQVLFHKLDALREVCCLCGSDDREHNSPCHDTRAAEE